METTRAEHLTGTVEMWTSQLPFYLSSFSGMVCFMLNVPALGVGKEGGRLQMPSLKVTALFHF